MIRSTKLQSMGGKFGPNWRSSKTLNWANYSDLFPPVEKTPNGSLVRGSSQKIPFIQVRNYEL